MPKEGVTLVNHKDILAFDEIVEVVETGVELGIKKVRLTGGEPLVRRGIVTLVEEIAKIKGIEDFGMTTNGILLSEFALPLKNGGLHRLNVSLDTTDSDEFSFITRGGDLTLVLKGIEEAVAAGFKNIKLNCVINESPQEENAEKVAEFAKKNGFQVRFIRKMDLEKGKFWQVIGGEGGKCSTCNRLRISATGTITPCLFSDKGYNVRELGVKEAFALAINSKPEKGVMSKTHKFYNIGG